MALLPVELCLGRHQRGESVVRGGWWHASRLVQPMYVQDRRAEHELAGSAAGR